MKKRSIVLSTIMAFLVILSLTASPLGSSAAGTIGPGTRVRLIKALANGQTVATYRYHTQSPDEVADVYYDTDWIGGAKRPAIIVIHGGWWHNATRTSGVAASQKWLDAGFVVMNIDYRVAADHTGYAGSGSEGVTVSGSRWPAQRVDTALAYDWLKANAAQFNVDPARVGLYGFSAGGHIAHMAAGYYGTGRFQASASVSAIVQPTRTAQIVLNGTYGGDDSTPTLGTSFGYMTSALGCSYPGCDSKWSSFQPETYFGSTRPAFYAIKGDADPVEPISAQLSVEAKLTAAGQDHKTIVVAGRGHDQNMVLGTGADDVARWNALVSWMKAKTL